MNKVRGQDPTGERQKIYDWLEQTAAQREKEEMGRGLTNLVAQMNYVETHFLSAVAEKYPGVVKKILGQERYLELIEEQRQRMSSRFERIAKRICMEVDYGE